MSNSAASNATPDPDSRRLQLLANSHGDVIQIDRNTDEKVRTLIMALAFLATAGVTLFIFGSASSSAAVNQVRDLTFDGHNWHAGNVFFIFFLGSLILSLASALTAADPHSYRLELLLPFTERSVKSYVYYGDIAHMTPDEWSAFSRGKVPEMEQLLLASYDTDIREVASRTVHKVRRLGDAQGFVFFAVVNLGLLGLVRLPNSSPGNRAAFLVAALSVLNLLAPYTAAFMKRDNYLQVTLGDLFSPRAIVFYLFPFGLTLGFLIWARWGGGPYWTAIAVGLTATFVTTHPMMSTAYEWLRERKNTRLPLHIICWSLFMGLAIASPFVPFTDPRLPNPAHVTLSVNPIANPNTGRPTGNRDVCADLTGPAFLVLRVQAYVDGYGIYPTPAPLSLGRNGNTSTCIVVRRARRVEFNFRQRLSDVSGFGKSVKL